MAVKSVTEPVGVRTRTAMPSSLPSNSGNTTPRPLQHRWKLGSYSTLQHGHDAGRGAGRPETLVRSVGMVMVMYPFSKPNVSFNTLAMGAKQFVVQDIAHNAVFGGQNVVVHTEDNRFGPLCRRRDDDLPRILEVCRCLFCIGEDPSRLDHEITLPAAHGKSAGLRSAVIWIS